MELENTSAPQPSESSPAERAGLVTAPDRARPLSRNDDIAAMFAAKGVGRSGWYGALPEAETGAGKAGGEKRSRAREQGGSGRTGAGEGSSFPSSSAAAVPAAAPAVPAGMTSGTAQQAAPSYPVFPPSARASARSALAASARSAASGAGQGMASSAASGGLAAERSAATMQGFAAPAAPVAEGRGHAATALAAAGMDGYPAPAGMGAEVGALTPSASPSPTPSPAPPAAAPVPDAVLRAAVAKAVQAGRAEAQRRAEALRVQNEMQSAVQARRDMEAAFPAVLERVAALVGEGFERTAFREDMRAWLRSQGVPDEAVASIRHGWELEIAAKAMLFDGMAEARRRAAAKLAEAPALLAPRGRGENDGSGRLRRARAALNKHPNSTEALAELFAAL